ncbi:MAG: hypothetical protein P8X95_27880 [Anaerolineales bacterium]
MTLQDQPRLRRLILIGTPLLTGMLLLFHPRPDPAEQLGGMAVYALFAPVASRFLAVHILFAPALALLGLSVILLLNGTRGIAARISRLSVFVFVVTYVMYETIVGTGTGLLVRNAAALPPDEQAVIVDAVIRNFEDPIFGDVSVLSGVASLSWLLSVALAAFPGLALEHGDARSWAEVRAGDHPVITLCVDTGTGRSVLRLPFKRS